MTKTHCPVYRRNVVRIALSLLLLLIAGCGKSKSESKPDQTAPQAPPSPPMAPADALTSIDAHAPATASDAAPTVADATTPAAPAPVDGFLFATSRAHPGHVLVASPADLSALAGTRWAFHDDKSRVCTATIGPALDCAGTPAAQLADAEGDCTTAMYGVPIDAKLAVTKVRAAAAPIDRAAGDAYGANEQRMADSKAAVEGGTPATVTRHTSTRVLERADHTSLVLAYGSIHDERAIIVYRLEGSPEQPELRELRELAAPAPSRVLGFSIDGDRALDVVIAHDRGAVLVTGAGDTIALSCTR